MGELAFRNPFVLRVGQVMSGFGAGCGLGIGVGVPIPLDIPGISGVMSAARGATRRNGGSHHMQSLIRRVGIKNLQAGIGCGVGIGHGFGVGIALKPGVAQQAAHLFQEVVSGLKTKLLSRADSGGGNRVQALPGVPTGSAQPSQNSQNSQQSPIAPSIAPSIKHSDSEVERLQTQNEILRTLLRHQARIEELEQQNALLRELLNNNKSEGDTGSSGIRDRSYVRLPNRQHPPSDCAICFSCRRRARRRT